MSAKHWTQDVSIFPPSFLPAGLDVSNCVDITAIGDEFRSYLEPSTGRIYSGKVYYAQYCEEVRNGMQIK